MTASKSNYIQVTGWVDIEMGGEIKPVTDLHLLYFPVSLFLWNIWLMWQNQPTRFNLQDSFTECKICRGGGHNFSYCQRHFSWPLTTGQHIQGSMQMCFFVPGLLHLPFPSFLLPSLLFSVYNMYSMNSLNYLYFMTSPPELYYYCFVSPPLLSFDHSDAQF